MEEIPTESKTMWVCFAIQLIITQTKNCYFNENAYKNSKKSQEKVSGYFQSVVVRSQLKMYVNHDWMEIWLSSFLLIANMKLIKSSSNY